jgi:hypothetical protein
MGCGGASKAKVSGKVTLNGQPLKSKVNVNFKCSDNNVLSAISDDSGEYTLSDVPVGPVTVTITPAGDGSPLGGPGRGRVNPGEAPPSRRPPAEKTEIPVAYSDASNPLLKDEVKEGENIINFNLTPAAK